MKLKAAFLPLLLTVASYAAQAQQVGETITLVREQIQCQETTVHHPCPYCYHYGYGDPGQDTQVATVKVSAVIRGASDFTGTASSCSAVDQLLGTGKYIKANIVREEAQQVSETLTTIHVDIRLGGPQGIVLSGYGEQ
jgi:hypothetical protein